MRRIGLFLIWMGLIDLGCSSKKESTISSKDSVKTYSIKILRDDSLVKILIDYNLHSKYHEEQEKAFENWGYDSAYYLQRIKAQAQNQPKVTLLVPTELKRIWVPVYSIDSVFYVQNDSNPQFRFDINDSTFNFFGGMNPVEPYVIDNIQKGANDFQISTRTPEKIILKRVKDSRTIYAMKFKGNCSFVIPLSDLNHFPIIVVNGKKGATTVDEWIDLGAINLCN